MGGPRDGIITARHRAAGQLRVRHVAGARQRRCLDQHKWSARRAIRAGHRGPVRYALVEWAWTDAVFGDVSTNRFSSVLGEASTDAPPGDARRCATRTRRGPRSSACSTRFARRGHRRISASSASRDGRRSPAPRARRDRFGAMTLAPFVEVAYARPTQAITPSAFVPEDSTARPRSGCCPAGVRVGVGPRAPPHGTLRCRAA